MTGREPSLVRALVLGAVVLAMAFAAVAALLLVPIWVMVQLFHD